MFPTKTVLLKFPLSDMPTQSVSKLLYGLKCHLPISWIKLSVGYPLVHGYDVAKARDVHSASIPLTRPQKPNYDATSDRGASQNATEHAIEDVLPNLSMARV